MCQTCLFLFLYGVRAELADVPAGPVDRLLILFALYFFLGLVGDLAEPKVVCLKLKGVANLSVLDVYFTKEIFLRDIFEVRVRIGDTVMFLLEV